MTAFIRPARTTDIEALVAIEATAFTFDAIARRSFRRLLASSSARILVVEREGRVVAYALLLMRKGDRVARLYSLAALPEFAGGGLGRMLLKAVEDAAVAAGRSLLRLEVREDNPRAIHLYERSGYRPIGRKEAFYEDGEAALRFEKRLAGAPAVADLRRAS